MTEFIERGMYAVLPNASIFLLVLQQTDECVSFMRLPDCQKVELDKDDLSVFLRLTKLDFIEQLPQDVFEVCSANCL